MSTELPKDMGDEFATLLFMEDEKHSHPTTGHYPSSASILYEGKVHGSCLRQQFYSHVGMAKDAKKGEKELWAISMGNWIHKGLQDLYCDYNNTAQREVSFEERIAGLDKPVKGRIDIVRAEGSRGNYNVELKSAYGRAFNFTDGLKVRPKDEHILQTMCYQALGKVDFTEIFYVARDNCYRKSYIITSKQGKFYIAGQPIEWRWEGIVERWKQLESYLKEGEAPAPDFLWCGECTKEKRCKECAWQCLYCSYKNMCKTQEKMRHALG